MYLKTDNQWVIRNGAFVQEFLYSVDNKLFYYNVLTFGGDNLVYRFSKSSHEDIQYEKECLLWEKNYQ